MLKARKLTWKKSRSLRMTSANNLVVLRQAGYEFVACVTTSQPGRMRIVCTVEISDSDSDSDLKFSNMRAPRPTLLQTLQNCGRVRDLDFANNSTRGVIQELLWNSFAQLHVLPFPSKSNLVMFAFLPALYLFWCGVLKNIRDMKKRLARLICYLYFFWSALISTRQLAVPAS